MPKLWEDTIDAHRRQVRDAILDATAALVAEHGLLGVTMSQIAAAAGIGRATLYKYYPGVEEILRAWHQRQVATHLEQLAEIRGHPGDAADRLHAMLAAYAHMRRARGQHHRHSPHAAELAAFVHRDEELAPAEQQLHELVRDLLVEAARAGHVREDVPPDELAAYCLHALGAASRLHADAAVRRLVEVVLAGLRRPY